MSWTNIIEKVIDLRDFCLICIENVNSSEEWSEWDE